MLSTILRVGVILSISSLMTLAGDTRTAGEAGDTRGIDTPASQPTTSGPNGESRDGMPAKSDAPPDGSLPEAKPKGPDIEPKAEDRPIESETEPAREHKPLRMNQKRARPAWMLPEPTAQPEGSQSSSTAAELVPGRAVTLANHEMALELAKKGFAYYKAKEYVLAIREYDSAIALDPENARLHYCRGAMNLWSDRFDEAIRDMHEAIRLNSEYREAYVGLGLASSRRAQSTFFTLAR